MRALRPVLLAFLIGSVIPLSAYGHAFEIFGKGMFSQNSISNSEYVTTVAASAGIAIALIPRVRIEARYTNETGLTNQFTAVAGATTLYVSNLLTETSIVSVGVDIDLFGDKYWVQPYLYAGAGYVYTTRSFYATTSLSIPSQLIRESPTYGLTPNLGAGMRIRLGQVLALEFEVFAFGIDLSKANPLINLSASVGVRLFI